MVADTYCCFFYARYIPYATLLAALTTPLCSLRPFAHYSARSIARSIARSLAALASLARATVHQSGELEELLLKHDLLLPIEEKNGQV